MSDSKSAAPASVVEGHQGALVRRANLPVPPDGSGEGEQTLSHPNQDASWGTPAVLLERELALEAIDDALDPLSDRLQGAELGPLIFAIRPDQPGAEFADLSLHAAIGKFLV